MKIPSLNTIATTRSMISEFKGLNRTPTIVGGEFSEMSNLTGDYYPLASVRDKRYTKHISESFISGSIDKDGLCYFLSEPSDERRPLYNTTLHYKGKSLLYAIDEPETHRTIVSMGAYIIVFPDKSRINIQSNPMTSESLESAFQPHGSSSTPIELTFTRCTAEGTSPDEMYVTRSDTKPENPYNNQQWIDTTEGAGEPLWQYYEATDEWKPVALNHVKISLLVLHIGDYFEVGDAVTVTGITEPGFTSLNGDHIVTFKARGFLVFSDVTIDYFSGTQYTGTADYGYMSVKRTVPEMDYVIEHNNRLYGCKFGEVDGKTVNEIYVSALGDPKNFRYYGTGADNAYAMSVGSDGKFTGAITYGGYPTFFKENTMHRVYGTEPATYQLLTTECRGVQSGSDKSLVIVGNALFYKSSEGVMRYTGAMPENISYKLGNDHYTEAISGRSGDKYYIAMRNSGSGKYELYCYDTKLGMWHREDCGLPLSMMSDAGKLIIYSSEGALLSGDLTYIDPLRESTDGLALEDGVVWSAETGDFGLDDPDKKYISRLLVRVRMAPGSRLNISIKYGSDREYQRIYTADGRSDKSYNIPIRPKRCEHFRVKFDGKGECFIYSITQTVERGSDI